MISGAVFAQRAAFHSNERKALRASVAYPLKHSAQRGVRGDGAGLQGQLLGHFLIIVPQVSLKGHRSFSPNV